MKKWTLILIACLALGLVAAGCGDDDDSGDSDKPAAADTATTETPAETKAPAAGDVVEVDIKDIKFLPHDVTVPKGGTIKWTNSDDFAHDVTKTGGVGPDFKSDTLDGGATYEQKFDTAGEIDYVCTIHSGQDGKIIVK